MIEIWKPVVGYEGLYEVSNHGRVKKTRTNHIMKIFPTKRGYLRVGLRKNEKRRFYYIHQLVGQAFLENPNNYTVVHHINHEDIQNNCVENLEWMDEETHRRLHGLWPKTVYQYTLDWKLVKIWPSVNECGRQLGYSQGNICDCCNNKYMREGNNIYKGFRWSYELIRAR